MNAESTRFRLDMLSESSRHDRENPPVQFGPAQIVAELGREPLIEAVEQASRTPERGRRTRLLFKFVDLRQQLSGPLLIAVRHGGFGTQGQQTWRVGYRMGVPLLTQTAELSCSLGERNEELRNAADGRFLESRSKLGPLSGVVFEKQSEQHPQDFVALLVGQLDGAGANRLQGLKKITLHPLDHVRRVTVGGQSGPVCFQDLSNLAKGVDREAV